MHLINIGFGLFQRCALAMLDIAMTLNYSLNLFGKEKMKCLDKGFGSYARNVSKF